MPQFDEKKQEKQIEELRYREEEELARILSEKYGVPYTDLSRVAINTEALRLLSEEEARAAEVAAFNKLGKKIELAVRAPAKGETAGIVKKLEERGYSVTTFMVSQASLERAWERYKDLSFAVETKAGVLDISGEDIQKIIADIKTLADTTTLIEETLKLKRAYRVSRILEVILGGAFATDASDIHIEPEESYVRLRYRLDGLLTDVIIFDAETYNLLLSRIKLVSGLKLNVKDTAQDGRFSVAIDQDDIEIRTSILPGAYGESIVLRLLNPKTIGLPMEKLGIEPRLYEILAREIKKPNGMILTTGPTGSGKTTALYAFLKKIHKPGIKIITIEDPIEYHLPGIVQTQADRKKYTFSSGLRSALRQDPDVIMIGEIRDEEVAETAINAALTGHLVFSTLHTNNAAGAFPRIIDLDVNPKVISSAVNLVMAQRLVRVLCPVCKKEAPFSEEEKRLVERVISSVVKKENIPENTAHSWKPGGCAACHEGYKGRIGIFEAIRMDEAIEKLVKESASEREIHDGARPQGILSLVEDGVIKVLNGVTSFEDLARVIDLEEAH